MASGKRIISENMYKYVIRENEKLKEQILYLQSALDESSDAELKKDLLRGLVVTDLSRVGRIEYQSNEAIEKQRLLSKIKN